MRLFFACSLFLLFAFTARAEFIVSSAILEFKAGGEMQQDIDIVSRSPDTDYIVTEITEVIHPGMPDEKRVLVSDPENSRLLVTPDKTILAPGGRRVLRFVLLKNPDESEHIYRVAIKPVVKGISNNSRVGLKILIGYEVLVIIRPANPVPSYTAKREGKVFTATNNGNTNIVFQNGQQCTVEKDCPLPPVLRVYPHETASVQLPFDRAVSYAVWEGAKSEDKQF